MPARGERPRWFAADLVLFTVGLLLSLFVFFRAAYDLARLGPALSWLAAGVGLAACVLGGGQLAALVRREAAFVGVGARAGLLAAVPVAFLGAGLDCSSALAGCTSVCAFLSHEWLVLVTLLALAAVGCRSAGLERTLTFVTFVFLLPNCRCANPVNVGWLRWFTLSPGCFGAAFGAGVLALLALRTGRFLGATLFFCWFVITGLLAFYVGHHFLHVPW